MMLTETAETVLKRRYYLKDEAGECLEDWKSLCLRVAKHVASVESEEDYLECSRKFFNMIYNLDFLPNSPCLMNAGTDMAQLAACLYYPLATLWNPSSQQ